MITEAIIIYIITGLMFIVNIVTAPINLLINILTPNYDSFINSVQSFFNLITPTLGFALSYTLIPPSAMALILIYWNLRLFLSPTISFVKMALGWIQKIKLW